VFYVWPAIRGFYFSLTDYSLLGPAEFVGLDNYQQMVDDRLFWNAMLVTAGYVAINIGTQTVLALLLAVLMQRQQPTVAPGIGNNPRRRTAARTSLPTYARP
jgi:multiple sugar transport system permease protein